MTSHSADELRALSEHVLYETQMLFQTANHLRDQADGRERLPWAIEMATVESFAMHTRVLIDFLWREPRAGQRRKHADDAYAADFFPPGGWEAVRRPMESTLDGIWQRASREIAHLSYKRIGQSEADRRWEFDSIAGSIGRAFRLFLEHVDHSLLVAGFEQKLRAAWPQYLNYPVAISFPPDQNPRSVATAALPDIGQLRRVSDEELIP